MFEELNMDAVCVAAARMGNANAEELKALWEETLQKYKNRALREFLATIYELI